MKKIFTVTLLFLTAVCLQAQTLSWDFRFLMGRERESVPVSRIIRMETGQDFLFTILPALNTYCYIIFYDSQRNISVLRDQPLNAGNEMSFGPFQLVSPSGTETIYVIMSLRRQGELERLIQGYKNNPESREHSNNLYREVVRLQNAASGLGEPAAVFIPGGGTTRGEQNFVTRFSGKDLYVRAITIRH